MNRLDLAPGPGASFRLKQLVSDALYSSRTRPIFGLALCLAAPLLLGITGNAQTADAPIATAPVPIQNDFEDGTTDSWVGFAGASVAVSNLEANTGSHSLLVTGRTQTFQGPGIDLTSVLTAGQPYLFRFTSRITFV